MARNITSVKSKEGWVFFEDVPIRSKLPVVGQSLWAGNIVTDQVISIEPVDLETRGLIASDAEGLEFYEITYRALNMAWNAKRLYALEKQNRRA